MSSIQAKLASLEKRLADVQRAAMSDGHISWLESIHINSIKASIKSLSLFVRKKEEEEAQQSAGADTGTTTDSSPSNEPANPSTSTNANPTNQEQEQEQQEPVVVEQPVQASAKLSGSVGKGGKNAKPDVLLVQQLLNKKINAGLTEDGFYGANTRKAIEAFQQKTFGWKDGLISAGGKTWEALSKGASAPVEDTTTTEEQNNNSSPAEDTTTTQPSNNSQENSVEANATLKAKVGTGGANAPGDVALVQKLLNGVGIKLSVNGQLDAATQAAIHSYQKSIFNGWSDGAINPGKKTIEKLLLKQQLDNLIDDEDQGELGLGIGADEGDVYKDQRDNQTLQLKNSRPGRNTPGDVQCNVTSLAMLLIAKNKGDEAGVVKLVKEKLAAKGVSIKSSWGLEELLAKYVDSRGLSIFSSSTMGVIAKALFGDKVSKSRDVHLNENDGKAILQKIKDELIPSIKRGAEAMISGRFTHGGHIVFVRSIKSKGIVLNDPYGACLAISQYARNGAVYSKSNFLANEELFKRRFSLRPGYFEKIKEKVIAGQTLPGDLGKDNYYTWADFLAIKPYRFVITEPH